MPMFVEIQFLKLFTKLGIMLNIPKLLKKLPKLIMKLDTYAVGVVEIQTVGVGDVKDDKVWYAVREAQLAVHEALENIVFFVKFMQPDLLIKFPKLWMLLKKLPKLC